MRFLILTLTLVAVCSCRAPAPSPFAGKKVTCLGPDGKIALSVMAASVEDFDEDAFTVNVAGGKTVQIARGTSMCILEDMTLVDMQAAMAPPAKPAESEKPIQPPPP